ncbi:MAG: antibiotic biosynthesis monooxygenase family protein [Bacteroidia bacterium]
MEKLKEAFTSAIWNVKPGKEEEFIKEWTEFAKWSLNIDNVSAHLLQDTDNHSRFISVGKWSHAEAIEEWREKTEFKERLSKIADLLAEPTKPNVMKEVSKVGDIVLV